MYFIFTVAEGIYLFTSGVPDQSQDMCTSYIEQATSGRGIKLHCILFNVDDYDDNGAIPGRYANITRKQTNIYNYSIVLLVHSVFFLYFCSSVSAGFEPTPLVQCTNLSSITTNHLAPSAKSSI